VDVSNNMPQSHDIPHHTNPVSCVECGGENVKKYRVLGQDVTDDGTQCDVLWVHWLKDYT